MTLARIRIEALDTEVSALGFGCASLGSRVAPAPGLAALERAYDAGVTWYDVAPSYGDGQAEVLLGRFLAGHPRGSVQVLTKVGIAPPAPSLKARLLRPAMRAAVSAVPSLRAAVRKRRPAATKLPLDAALVSRSVDASLRRLGTDYVDVLALHDATPEEVVRDDVLRALDSVCTSGKARAIAIASSTEAAIAGTAASSLYSIVQMANNIPDPGLRRFREAASRMPDLITHTVFGNEGAAKLLADWIQVNPTTQAMLLEAGYLGEPIEQAKYLLADFAFSTNRDGVVVLSMFKDDHLNYNIARRSNLGGDQPVYAIAARFREQV